MQPKSIISAVLEEVNIKYCPIRDQRVFSKYSGCNQGALASFHLDNLNSTEKKAKIKMLELRISALERKQRRIQSYKDEALGIWY